MKTPKIVFTLSTISLVMGLMDEAHAASDPTHRPVEVNGPVFASTASGSAAIYMTNTSGAGEDFVMVIPSHYRMHDSDD
jgi:hypothetical protein